MICYSFVVLQLSQWPQKYIENEKVKNFIYIFLVNFTHTKWSFKPSVSEIFGLLAKYMNKKWILTKLFFNNVRHFAIMLDMSLTCWMCHFVSVLSLTKYSLNSILHYQWRKCQKNLNSTTLDWENSSENSSLDHRLVLNVWRDIMDCGPVGAKSAEFCSTLHPSLFT